jgi:hypothetical protein
VSHYFCSTAEICHEGPRLFTPLPQHHRRALPRRTFSSHQRTYTLDIIQRAAIVDCKPCTTPVDIQAKLATDSGPLVQNASQFRSIAEALQYLTFTRSDIAYAVQQICLHMHDPRESHLTAMKRILR